MSEYGNKSHSSGYLGENNIIMKRILHKNDYVFVGTFDFRWGRRLAYEKVLVGV